MLECTCKGRADQSNVHQLGVCSFLMEQSAGVPCRAGHCPEATIEAKESFSPDDGFDCMLHCQPMKLQGNSFTVESTTVKLKWNLG